MARTATKRAPAKKITGASAPVIQNRTTGGAGDLSPAPRRSSAMGFEAGQTGRRLRAIPSISLAINTQLRMYGRTIVARSRYLATNNPYAAAAKESYVSALVGNGIKPASLVTDKKQKAAIPSSLILPPI